MYTFVWAGEVFEVMVRVDMFRRFLAQDDGGHGEKCVRRANDIVQVYGLRAKRKRVGSKTTPWEVESDVKLHTVDVVKGLKVKN